MADFHKLLSDKKMAQKDTEGNLIIPSEKKEDIVALLGDIASLTGITLDMNLLKYYTDQIWLKYGSVEKWQDYFQFVKEVCVEDMPWIRKTDPTCIAKIMNFAYDLYKFENMGIATYNNYILQLRDQFHPLYAMKGWNSYEWLSAFFKNKALNNFNTQNSSAKSRKEFLFLEYAKIVNYPKNLIWNMNMDLRMDLILQEINEQ